MSKNFTIEEFINNAIKMHGDKYNYSKTNYKNCFTPINIICKIHGVFSQIPNNHIRGKGCSKCAKNGVLLTTEEFIKKSINVHGIKYDYSDTIYKKSKSKVDIICLNHGIFKQTPYSHLSGSGCPACYKKSRTSNSDEFIIKSKEIHGEIYNYDSVKFKNDKTKVIITCKKHGSFNQRPDVHKNGGGCPTCSSSKGEKIISSLLIKNNINFVIEKMFDDCIFKRRLKFDFYLPDHNMCIEYDGAQHFVSIDYYGGNDKLNVTKQRDKIKDEYCIKNNIRLLRISYKDDINTKLSNLIKF